MSDKKDTRWATRYKQDRGEKSEEEEQNPRGFCSAARNEVAFLDFFFPIFIASKEQKGTGENVAEKSFSRVSN